jgi:amidase
MRTKRLSSEELTKAFLRRAAVAQLATNCLTELMWDDAIQRARHLDSLPEPIGPLHGLPISVKEQLGTKGSNQQANGSYVAYVGKHQGSSLLLDILWDAGCVYFARTTQPQTIMHLETESNIYGRTVNPYNRNLTPGGSSGGESALIGLRGSVLVSLIGPFSLSCRC